MNRNASCSNRLECDGRSLAELCRESSKILEEALDMPPRELGGAVEQAQKRVVGVRDCLIERLRADDRSGKQSFDRKALDRINVALSLIAGLAYPATGIHKRYMKDATKILEEVQNELPD